MIAAFWFLAILVSAAVSYVVTLPLRWRMNAMENLCDMLARAVRGDFDRKEE